MDATSRARFAWKFNAQTREFEVTDNGTRIAGFMRAMDAFAFYNGKRFEDTRADLAARGVTPQAGRASTYKGR